MLEVLVGEGVAQQQASRGLGELTGGPAEGGNQLSERELEVLDEERHLFPEPILGVMVGEFGAPLDADSLIA